MSLSRRPIRAPTWKGTRKSYWCQNGMSRTNGIHLCKQLLLQFQILGDGLGHEVCLFHRRGQVCLHADRARISKILPGAKRPISSMRCRCPLCERVPCASTSGNTVRQAHLEACYREGLAIPCPMRPAPITPTLLIPSAISLFIASPSFPIPIDRVVPSLPQEILPPHKSSNQIRQSMPPLLTFEC